MNDVLIFMIVISETAYYGLVINHMKKKIYTNIREKEGHI